MWQMILAFVCLALGLGQIAIGLRLATLEEKVAAIAAYEDITNSGAKR